MGVRMGWLCMLREKGGWDGMVERDGVEEGERKVEYLYVRHGTVRVDLVACRLNDERTVSCHRYGSAQDRM